MQFKHPEILYALLLLIIPIIIHLFQLQRFVKVPFTNIKFLKNIEQQTRKSSRLKKWLILITRLFAFACLIIAFAQPYFSKYKTSQNFNISIYLDNSFSMQAKGNSGELLKSISQNIIENLNNNNTNISLLTNSTFLENTNSNNLKNELINIDYHPLASNLNTTLLQLKSNKSNKTNTLYKKVLISDFQHINSLKENAFTNVNSNITLLKKTPNSVNNIFIDSVYVKNNLNSDITINAVIKSLQNSNNPIPVSLFEESKLIGKATVNFKDSIQKTVKFKIPNTLNFNGKITLTDPLLEFDNDFYFTISKPTKTNVLSIGNHNIFLAKIYTENEFNFKQFKLQNLNYNNIQNQDLIILNELDNIPLELTKTIEDFSKNGGSIVIIPSEHISIESYQQLFQTCEIGTLKTKDTIQHKVTSINFEHPLLNDVFEKKVTNFQYPKFKTNYTSQLYRSNSILKFENNTDFISSIEKEHSSIYWVSAPINKSNSSFSNSSLIVPVFYNFGKNSLKSSPLYYTIKPDVAIDIKTKIKKDEVLSIHSNNQSFIPLQNVSQNKVSIQVENNILKSGFYTISNKSTPIKTVAFNYNREESVLNYQNLQELKTNQNNITISSSIDDIFKEINNEQKINWLFKWFLAFSALFLFIEILILKYFKI